MIPKGTPFGIEERKEERKNMMNLKKIGALIIAIMLVLAMAIPAFATETEGGADTEGGTGSGTTPAETPAVTAEDNTIKLGGLGASDTATYRQIIVRSGAGWAWNPDYIDTAKLGTADEAAALLATVVGTDSTDGAITEATARKIAGAIKGEGTAMTNTSGTASASDLTPGLYFVQAAAKDAGVLYNPVFLAVQSSNEGSVVTLPLSYPSNGAAKKQTTDVTKTAKNKAGTEVHATDENVGDEIEFTVTTTLPVFLDNYTNPVFKVSDAMTSGLSFVDGSLKMKIGDGTATAPTSNKWTADSKDVATFTKTDAQNWKVDFDAAYLKTVTTPTTVVITYKAIITDAAKNVNPEDNTVTIEYSRNPDNESDHGTDSDTTKHYTFGLDIDLFGGESENYKTSDFVKVGVDKDGNPIVTTETTYSDTETRTNPLSGAEFILLNSEKNPYTNGTAEGENQTIKNGQTKVGSEWKNFTTDTTGRFPLSGLEAGTYYLREVKAPAGYKTLTSDISIVIEATYDEDTKELTGYTVTVNGEDATKSSYSVNQGDKDTVTIDKTAGSAGDTITDIKNVQGVELPSTGGMGTHIFYILGAILVLGAGIVLVSRRRAGDR